MVDGISDNYAQFTRLSGSAPSKSMPLPAVPCASVPSHQDKSISVEVPVPQKVLATAAVNTEAAMHSRLSEQELKLPEHLISPSSHHRQKLSNSPLLFTAYYIAVEGRRWRKVDQTTKPRVLKVESANKLLAPVACSHLLLRERRLADRNLIDLHGTTCL